MSSTSDNSKENASAQSSKKFDPYGIEPNMEQAIDQHAFRLEQTAGGYADRYGIDAADPGLGTDGGNIKHWPRDSMEMKAPPSNLEIIDTESRAVA